MSSSEAEGGAAVMKTAAAEAEQGETSADEAKQAKDKEAYAYYVLAILTFVYMFNFIDRQIIAILSPAIKEDLGLSDSVLGLLKGLAFAVLYTTLGIPIAWAADRWNRVTIMTIAATVWSAFTALSGLAANALQLTLARVGVGIGE
ncbi:MAG: MFS transporter, partial [Parvularculaceae bacterium]